MHYFAHKMTIIRTQIMGSYYFFFENFLQQNYAYNKYYFTPATQCFICNSYFSQNVIL